MSQPQALPMTGPTLEDPLKAKTGLGKLAGLAGLLIKQKADELEDVTGGEKENKYKVYSMDGEKLFEAKEKSDLCARQCCGPSRPFDMKVEDELDKERKVMQVHRPLRCQSCWFPCHLQELEVEVEGAPAGTVVQRWSPLRPRFDVLGPGGEQVVWIEGPLCTWDCCWEVTFDLHQPGVEGKVGHHGAPLPQVGEISKKWSGMGKEWMTDADNFGVSFPVNLDVKVIRYST